MLDCCSHACKKKIARTYRPNEMPGDENFTAYLKKLAKEWGTITNALVDAVEVFAVDQEQFNSARSHAVQCANGHVSHAVVVSQRLCFFMFRVGLLMASNWDLRDSGNLHRRNDWPTADALNELASIVTDYFGATSLKDVRFDSFHKLLNASDQTARTLSLQAIDSAELFLLFHEFFHVVPSSLRPQLAFGNLTKAFWASPRGKAWTNEMEIDASATSTLLVAASERYSALGGDKPWACLVVFSGADLALHSIEFLDRISHGSITTTDGVSHPACNSHPPAQFRRNSWSHMSQSLALNFARLTEREWSDVRVSVGALMSAREELFNRFFDARGDVVADVRG